MIPGSFFFSLGMIIRTTRGLQLRYELSPTNEASLS